MRRDPNASVRMSVRPSHQQFGTLVVAVCLVAGGVVVVAPSASATAVWSVAPGPKPSGSTYGEISGVSCPSTTSCFAVGTYEHNGPFPKGLVAHRNGSHWSSMSQLVPCRVRLVPHGPGGGDGEGRESSTHHPHITPDLGPPVSLRRLALCARDRAGEAASSGTSARSCSTTRGPAKFVRQHSDERILRR